MQQEWQTQRRRNNQQQIRYNPNRVTTQQHQEQTGITSIPTKKNTYIDLDVQDDITGEEKKKENIDPIHEERPQNIASGNNQQNQGKANTQGVHRDNSEAGKDRE